MCAVMCSICMWKCFTSGSQPDSPGNFHDFHTTFLGVLALGVGAQFRINTTVTLGTKYLGTIVPAKIYTFLYIGCTYLYMYYKCVYSNI